MNNKAKFLTLATLTAAASFFGFNAHAELSLNAVVEKIELVSDADDYFNTARTVYEPANRIGANDTKEVDLFDKTNGVTFPLQKPETGLYPTAIVHFSTLEISSSVPAAGVEDITDDLIASGQMFDYAGKTVLVMGDIGAGAAGSIDAEVMGGAGAGQISMQPITVSTTSFVMPELNFGMPAEKAGETATSVALLSLPEFQTLARNIDSDDVGDVTVQVESIVFDGVGSTGNEFAMGTNRITVGLFDTTLPEKPAYVSRYRPAASVEAGDYEDVVFYDVPEGFDFVPLAWYDEDNDKRLDAGEFVTAFNFAVGTAKFTMDDDGYDYTNDGATGTLSQTPVAMNDRKFDLEIALAAADIAASLANDAAAVSSTIVSTVFDDGSGGAGSTETAGTLTADLIINNGVTDITIPITFGADAGGGDATIAHGEDMYVVLEDSSAFDVAGASYDADNEVLTIAAIPASITTIGADSEYSVDLTIDEIANSTGAFTTYNGAPVTVTWTQGDLAITDGVVAPAVGAIDITPIVAD